MDRDSLSELLSSGAALFSDNTRLLSLRFAPGSGISEGSLLPLSLAGEEALSESYRYTLDGLSADAYLELKDFLGQPVELALLLPEGGARLLTGLVTRAEQAGSDGGFAKYRLVIEPALATLAHRRTSRVFQDRSVPQIVAAVLDEHLAGNPALARSFQYRLELGQRYPARSYTLQYRESDLAFIERLLAEEGISYRYTHGPDPTTSLALAAPPHAAEDDEAILHTLVLFDALTPVAASDGPVRFHRTDGVEAEDAIDRWSGVRTIQAGASQLATWDYKAASRLPAGAATGQSDGTELGTTLEDYDPQAPYYAGDDAELARYAALRQQAKDLAAKRFAGEGSARHLVPGGSFELIEHPVHDQDSPEDREFHVTRVAFEAENNLPAEARTRLGGLLTEEAPSGQNRPPYRNRFEAVRRHVPVVPEYSRTRHAKPTAPGATTATVVGPAGEEIYTDELGRIRVQFHWQRPQEHPEGGAAFDEHSSTWIRVAYPSAGAQWGSQSIPRIGQEVVVSFLEGDIDRPIVTGVVHNGSHRPPAFSGAGSLPANKPLSGVKTKEYKGGRYNELVFDDTTGEIRAKLSSEHGKTQLNQGYLIHPRTDGKGEPRGEGFELRTDEAGALRAGKGLLVSTWARLNARENQLARSEALALMDECLALFKQLGEYAAQHEAAPIDPAPHEKLTHALRDWEGGSNTAPNQSNGGTPAIAVTAPGGILHSTPQTLASHAGHNLDQVAGHHLQQAAGGRATLNAGQGVSLFAHEGGMKAIAHHGELLLQSQHDSTRLNAEQNVTVTASQGKITGMAQQEIVWVTSGGAYLKLAGGNVEIGCPGEFTVRAAGYEMKGPGGMAIVLPELPVSAPGQFGQQFTIVDPLSGEMQKSILRIRKKN